MELKKKPGIRSRRTELMPEIIELYYLKNLTLSEVSEKIGVKRNTIKKWICTFVRENQESLSTMARKERIKNQAKPSSGMPEQRLVEELQALRRENARLEKELRYEKMMSHAYDTMIDVAEEMFNIPIRKKAGTNP